MTIAEKIDAIEKFMDAELLKKRAGRADFMRRGTNDYRIAIQAVMNPNEKTRTARIFSRSQESYEYGVLRILEGAGITYQRGNDAPRGGIKGDYVIVK